MTTACPEEERLVRLYGDALDATEVQALELHTDHCARCQGVLAALRALDAAIAEPDAPSPEFLERMFALPDSAQADHRTGRLIAVVVAAAAVLLVALVVRSRLGERDDAGRRYAEPSAIGPTQATTAAPDTAPALPADLSLPVLHRLARGDDAERARLALVRLGRLGRRASLPVLIDAVRMADRRLEAVKALGALGDARAVPTLEPLLREPQVAVAAREALVRVGGGEAAVALGRAIADAEAPEALGLLTDALARANGAVGVRGLGRLLESEDPARAGAARAAVRRHERRLLPHALAELESPSETSVASALHVLDVLASPAAVPALGHLLQQRAHRARAAEVLVRIDTADAAAALWHARPFAEARQAFRRAGPATERWLLEQLERAGRGEKRRAIDLLGLCARSKSVPRLAAFAEDPALAPDVLLALGRIGGTPAVEALAALARRPALRRRAVEALGLTGSPAAVVQLERLGTDTRSLRVDAQRALATIPRAEAVEAILRLDGGRRAHRSTERVLRGMDRVLVLATLDALLDALLEEDTASEVDLAATARRVRYAVGGSAGADAPRVALN